MSQASSSSFPVQVTWISNSRVGSCNAYSGRSQTPTIRGLNTNSGMACYVTKQIPAIASSMFDMLMLSQMLS
ncbi:uncharacterized protein FOMMEDRAFT_158631 [Fomitiporia mediterranea MF3/22]|uniref:uncharacterized protein n=1 Tax=Fomitiporia mediterranea (strain MF3/22) TaxID=694068 RepID=UPI000440905A|nr:uncharacterized protein FOMMEDRAFT_158631 [Fomitiporia mediterranea MF3/22]EJD01483.1 hypothetical protein FOMMEDRAFT_158631 [Fomitiporia mediterranea MF3/22]